MNGPVHSGVSSAKCASVIASFVFHIVVCKYENELGKLPIFTVSKIRLATDRRKEVIISDVEQSQSRMEKVFQAPGTHGLEKNDCSLELYNRWDTKRKPCSTEIDLIRCVICTLR